MGDMVVSSVPAGTWLFEAVFILEAIFELKKENKKRTRT
jgi:hypothetical protein